MLGGLTIYPRVANFLQCMHAKNYQNWLAVDNVIAKIIRLTFFGPPCTSGTVLYLPCKSIILSTSLNCPEASNVRQCSKVPC